MSDVLNSKLFRQGTVDAFNLVRGREVAAENARKNDIPPRVKKMTLKDLKERREKKFKMD